MSHPGTPILPHPELASPLSEQDIAVLNELSDASQVRAWTQHKVEQYTKYIKALLAIHNSIAPIDKLPNELLQKIFAYVPFKAEWDSRLYTALDPYNLITYRKGPGDDEDDGSDEDEDKDEHRDRGDRRRYLVDLFLDRSAPLPLKMGAWRTSDNYRTGWATFEDRFDRVTTFEVEVDNGGDFYDAFRVVASGMKRLESLELCIRNESGIYEEEFTLDQWRAEDLPCLRELWTDARLFCRAMTVPSLHTITLYGFRDMDTLPGLLDALEGCPALTVIHRLYFSPDLAHGEQKEQTLDRIVNLPNLRSLTLGGLIPTIYSFLSCLSFPWTTKLDVSVHSSLDPGEFALPSILPRRISGLHTPPTIDRLYIQSQPQPFYTDPLQPYVFMIGFVQGVERLQVAPVFRLCRTSHFLQFLEAFAACTVTELALDLGPLPGHLDGEFWRQFFAALPDVRRLELMSRAVESRATKRAIAEYFLASVRPLQQAGYETSLTWVLRGEVGTTSHLQEELGDVEEVLHAHTHQGGHLKRLELYITTSGPGTMYWSKISSVSQITTDGEASRFVIRDYVSLLAGAAGSVIVGGGWEFAEDDHHNMGDGASNGKDGIPVQPV